jgi:restriction system protein
MPIPKHNEIRIPVLEYLKSKGPASTKQMIEPLSHYFKLTDEEVNQMYESGNGPVFKDRISWAITYLGFTDLISKVKRGFYSITPKGIEMLRTPDKIDGYIDKMHALREATKIKRQEDGETLPPETAEKVAAKEKLTPQEKLYQSYASIKKSILDEILDTIIGKTPDAFEALVVKLLQKMGYGGEVKDSGIVTKLSNDHGIDGIIKKDVLGLEKIYIQAKNYDRENGIGREHIQKFVGAIAGVQSKNGVFITTSYYHKTAIDYVRSLNGNPNLILINGEELANHVYEYDLGMQTEQVITIKKLDSEFWDGMKDK